jgi:hypothetical protein
MRCAPASTSTRCLVHAETVSCPLSWLLFCCAHHSSIHCTRRLARAAARGHMRCVQLYCQTAAATQRSAGHAQVVREDKNLDALRSDPRFTKLIDEYDEPVFNSGALKWVVHDVRPRAQHQSAWWTHAD